MKTNDDIREYFANVVNHAIDELIDEFDQKEGYSAGYCLIPMSFKDKPPLEMRNGISVKFPNGTEKNVSVCWFKGSDHILIGRIDALGGDTTLMKEADKDYLKERIRELIGE